ncbi:MAG: CBS domain-containing protein, partial [Azonexus sp.]|nr:CBS domain-containing protein [Azonexus sp.]
MTLPVLVRAHKLSQNASLCVSGFNLISADSPAIEAMTDFSRVNVVSIGPDAVVDEANARMISRGVRLLMVVGKNEDVLGLITAR